MDRWLHDRGCSGRLTYTSFFSSDPRREGEQEEEHTVSDYFFYQDVQHDVGGRELTILPI